jgi:hypothetical protein
MGCDGASKYDARVAVDFPSTRELLRRASLRALKFDLVCSPLPGLFAGAASGSLLVGVLSAAGWIVVAFVPLTLLIRVHFIRKLAGNPERFEAPRWLARKGFPWAIEASHYQSAPMQVDVRGYLAVVGQELRFIPARGQSGFRFVRTAPQPWRSFADEITSIEVAMPPVAFAIGRLPHLRIVTSDTKVAWFMTGSCTASEAASKLHALLFGPTWAS